MWDAKKLFKGEPKFKNMFKFDHLWGMLNDLPKFKDDNIQEKQSRIKNTAKGDHMLYDIYCEKNK